MAVKPRTIWFSDEDWVVLKKVAADRGSTISSLVRDFWIVAADPRPAAAAYRDPAVAYSGPSFEPKHVGTGTAEKITPPAMAGFGRSAPAPKPVKKGKS